MAWITCLILAFLACIIAVWNAGNNLKLEGEIREVKKKIQAKKASTSALEQAQISRILKNVSRIEEELEDLKGSEEEIPPELREKMGALQDEMKELESSLLLLSGETDSSEQ